MNFFISWWVGVFFCFSVLAQAKTHDLPDSLAEQALTEVAPFTFTPADFDFRDFEVRWVGAPLENAQISLGAKSLEWVRVADVLVIPRARLMVQAEGLQGGQLRNVGSTQSFALHGDGSGRAEIPVAMISGPQNATEIILSRDGKEYRGQVEVRYRPRPFNRGRILVDTTCSSYQIDLYQIELPVDSWAYLGCRLVYVNGAQHRTSSLDVYVFWDNVGQEIEIDGVRTPSTSISVWPIRLRSAPGQVKLVSGKNGRFAFRYRIAENLHLFNLGVGIGPYQYSVDGAFDAVSTVAPLVTIYGSYFMAENMRLVAFDATAIHSRFFTDFGIYLLIEQVKALDARFSLRLLLGAHALLFRVDDQTYFRLSGPQGVEIVFDDFISRANNLSVGAFIHPLIDGRSYANVWVRWGGAIFGEFNYIAWREKIDTGRVYNRSMGLTVGFPLGQFL